MNCEREEKARCYKSIMRLSCACDDEDGCNVAWPKYFRPLVHRFKLSKDYRSSAFNDSLCSVNIVHDVIHITFVFLQNETDELAMLNVENEVLGY